MRQHRYIRPEIKELRRRAKYTIIQIKDDIKFERSSMRWWHKDNEYIINKKFEIRRLKSLLKISKG